MDNKYYDHDYDRPVVGVELDDVLMVDDLLKEDGGPHSAALSDSGTYTPKPVPMPFSNYFDPDVVDQELEQVWGKSWTVACREEDIPNVGDMTRYDLVDTSYLIVRTGSETIKAYYNSCRHRGRRLCDDTKNADKIMCPFHGWTWSLEGELVWVPNRPEFPYVKNEGYSLPEVNVESWAGNVFINPDPDAGPLADALGILKEHFLEYPTQEYATVSLVRKKIRANWKLAQEAFMEAYHMVETHWDALPFSGDANTKIDCWSSDNNRSCVSRVLTPLAIPSPYLEGKVSNKESLRVFMSNMGYTGELPDCESLGELRGFAAGLRRKQLEEMSGKNFDHQPTSQLLDAVKYFMYPNFHPWWGDGVPLWYRFTPSSRDPNECLMEVRFLAPIPASGEQPPVAKPIDLGFDDKCEGMPELSFLGHVFDQDMGNLENVQAGIKAAHKLKASNSLAQTQEAGITHFYEVYSKRMKEG